MNLQTETNKQRAFMALYDPAHSRLLRFCQTRIISQADAKDAASETVLRAWEQFDKLRAEQAFLGFLFGIAIRVVQEKQRRKKWWGLFSSEKAEATKSDAASPEVQTDVRLLREAMQHLPAVQQEAVVLHEIAGLPLAEIAELQGVTLSAVKSRVARGRAQLARLLGAANHPDMLPESTIILCRNEA